MGSEKPLNMARRTYQVLLLCFAATLFYSGAIQGAEQEVQDFEFADSDNEVKIVKRAAVDTDDEDFLADEAGSTPDSEYEGSGTLEPPVTKRPVVGDYPSYFRVTINITNLVYRSSLGNRNSQDFRQMARTLQRQIQQLFENIQGQQLVTILQFSPGSLLVTFDLGSQGFASEDELRRVLEEAIRSGAIGTNAVSPVGFSFNPLDARAGDWCNLGELFCSESRICIDRILACDGVRDCPNGEDENLCPNVQCPAYVGRDPDALPRSGSNWANLLINNAFPCEGIIVGWEYYRLIRDGSAFVGVWRQRSDQEFVLVRKTELPSAPVGINNVELEEPIPVLRGDFIGIFYPRSVPSNVIAQATLADDTVAANELYQTYNAEFYDNMVVEGEPFDLNSVRYSSTNSTFSIRAIMDYSTVGRPDFEYTCSPNEFACGDGLCIKQEYQCDGQADCNNGVDEENCRPSVTPSTEIEPCLEGRFRCTDGTCINRILKCDGKPDCSDGSDERCTGCSEDEFTCNNRECVLASRRCDRVRDCTDGSDELNCPAPGCRVDEFTCDDGECVPSVGRCDRRRDCRDGSDENNCPSSRRCADNEFRCQDNSCIDARLLCDSRADCPNGEDEFRCTSIPCAPEEFRCEHGLCIPLALRCNKMTDCPEGSDELDCPTESPCTDSQFTCQDNGCIDAERVCDAYPDCQDNSDEDPELCLPTIPTIPPSCPEGLFRCDSGICIDARRECDGNADCFDGTDEIDCEPRRCRDGEFRCDDGVCIDGRLQCDGVTDCADLSDESRCACRTNEFQCQRDRRCIDIRRQCDGRRDCRDGSDEMDCTCGAGQFRCTMGQCIDARRRCDTRIDCLDRSDEVDCTSIVTCSPNQFTCDNGRCVNILSRCDGVPDCSDRSDEAGCPCRSNEFECANGECISANLRCNRAYDCRDGSDERECPCRENEFRCGDGRCISQARVCDRQRDCNDGADEFNCDRCRPSEFECNDGTCVSLRSRCNRFGECPDSSDEFNCTCNRSEFRCNNGQCVSIQARCNRRDDCVDQSDELNCACRQDQFTCANGQCIDQRLTCDGRAHCRDLSDEANCPTPPSLQCHPGQFQCTNGQCIDAGFGCDGEVDCLDNSDEINCRSDITTTVKVKLKGLSKSNNQTDKSNKPVSLTASRPRCPGDQFQCETGHCLDLSRKCDGRADCPNGSDENDCPTCAPNQFTCASNGACISNTRRCDRRNDCEDGSDERECPCGEGEFTCVSDGRCLPPGYRCNGNPDCRDGSDEQDCPQECTSREFRCSDDQCISRTRLCDGRFDCSDGSDERNCVTDVTISVSPQMMRKRIGTSATFVCQVTGNPPPRIQWSRRTGGAMPPQASESNGRLTIPNLRPEDAGDYLCQAVSSAGTFEAVARLEVDYIGPPTSRPDPDGPCRRDEATCSNGQCIPRDYICDGEPDCDDGSDENDCNAPLPCEPNEFRCNNGRCAMKIWRCDGDDDCFDGSDEQNCPSRRPGDPCQSDEFMCNTNDQCVPASYQCDGEIDCLDRSDEVGCVQPSIVTPPLPEITVEINGTFTIICEAIGVPTPLIVWRLNWGNIPTGNRVTVTSEDGRGTLTVRNAIPADAGAYTCEAINTRGSIFAIPDALIIVRRTVGVCQAPLFNAEALELGECVRCFCYGHTQTCFSSSLQLSQITLGNQVQLVRRNTLEPAEKSFIQYVPSSREFQVTDFNNVLRTGSYYWSLPYQYLSKRLSSYGGELTYDVFYDVDGFDVPTSDPDVIIAGNGITLTHRSQTEFRPRAPTTVRVPLVETAWERTRDTQRGGPISDYATREDLMMVLENVTTILIRATYDNRQSLIRLGNVLLTTGVTQATGLGRAVYVEECTCPTGYTGYSCEECAPGFYRVERGRYGRECIACTCNGHSNDCDPFNGICRNCRDNTAGPYCNQCAPGFVGDARSGRPDACQPCPCPLTVPSNQFSRTCILDTDGEITCTACPTGYEGRRCERCAEGYVGFPLTIGDRCRPKGDIDVVCDPRGSVSNLPDVVTRQCSCKPNVEGQLCNRCKPDTFYLSADYPYGCISCFCMGVTQTCQSTTYNRAQVSIAFNQSPAGVFLTDMMQKEKVDQGLTIDRQNRELVYRRFNSIDRDIRYWSLPQQFLGDKVTAYGGNLRFTLRYRSGRDSSPTPLSDPMVEISGNDIALVYRGREQPQEGRQQSFSVPLIETEWFRMDGERATREHLLMALADLDFVLIRATYTQDTDEAGISAISLDIGEDRVTGRERAYPVEQCACPRGYKGLSCEDCDTGYTRTGTGLYLGLCQPCQCNGHSSECDPENGVCRNCRHNTEGANCERCVRGYYGDATRGSINDCQKCPCPLTESPNQFSQECILDTDGQVTCTACPVGHTGRNCERCADGYQGNPNRPGDFCKLINVTCDCDPRGTVPNTLCDPNTEQCRCKNNVLGRRCNTCQEGYFHLNRDNEQGCLRCFCMGITSQCSSSNYYRDEITPMMNSDGTHNFALTNRRLSRTITDGFRMNAERNEITFDNFEGIQREQESLFFQLPPKFRGDKVTSYGGYLRFGLSYTTAFDTGRDYMDVDVEIISKQDKRMYYLFRPSPKARETYNYDILLREDSFRNLMDGQTPSRAAFLTVLADIDAILIRATYHTVMDTVSIRDLRMEIAVPAPTGNIGAPEVESCICPEGYTGLSCQECAPGYLRMEDAGTALGRCVRCNCNGHASSCDTETGVCRDCLHNTEGERCERCARGYYGDPTNGTPNDCRVCPCPLTIPTNQFSPTCFLDQDDRVTCDRCPAGYTGRDCGQCAPGYQGNPREPGGRCEEERDVNIPSVTVTPVSISEPLGSTATFQCRPDGRGPFNVVWSRLDGRPLPRRAVQSPGPNYLLTISNLEYADSARYVCSVTNAAGSNRDTATLNVERPGTPIRIRIEEPTTFVSRPGQTARFVCVAVQFSTANYVLSWMKDGGPLPSKVIDQNGVLLIPNLDENDLGTYTCTGSDPGSVDRATATIRFGTVVDPPSVRIEPRYLQVEEGDRVEFQCIAEGSPRPTVRWNKGPDGPLPSYVTTNENGLLRIDSVSMDDQSEYYCTATNSEGTMSVRTIVYVQRIARVEVIVRRTNITAIIGESEQLTCYAEGSNDVNLVWSREGGLPVGATQDNGVLTLTNIQPSYAGNYICTGTTITGIVGRGTARITVIGTRYTAPTVRIDPDRQTVGSGTTGTLRCIVTGDPKPEITWSRARGELSSNHVTQGEILRIQQASMEDRGIYVCAASNAAGRAQASAIVDIERREPPTSIELYPDNQQTKSPGGSALFQCRVVGGIPTPTVTWSRAGGREFTSNTEVKADMGVLMFTSLTAAEQGEYMCSATNEVGTITATASLRVEGPPTVQITPPRVTSIVGERVNIECVGVGDPTPNVFWRSGQRRRSDVLPEAFDAGPGTARLLFESIKKSDAGRYICVATNEKGKTEESVDIAVGDRDGPGVVIEGPEQLNLVTGQSVELSCSSRGIPNPRVRWRRRNNQPLPPGHSVRNGVLSIPRIEPEYAGEYICSVTSEVIEADYSTSIYIIVSVTPRLTISPSRLSARPGERITLRCQPSGPGPFNIEWMKVGGTLNPQARETNGVLEIRQATRADAGRYRCVATSSAGRTEGYADVSIVAPPVVNVVPKQSSSVTGQSLEIRCDVQGARPEAISWVKEGGNLPLQHQVRNGVLTIYNIQPEDTGRYICTATNEAGSARDFAFVRVVSTGTGDISVGPAVQRALVGETIDFECVVSASSEPTVTWTKVDGPMPAEAIIGKTKLTFLNAKPEHSGIYRCIATTPEGTVQSQVQLFVQSQPTISVQQDYTTAALGTPAQLKCDASGSPKPSISWVKEDGDLPDEHSISQEGDLFIPRVRAEDGGKYNCLASNNFGQSAYPVVLIVGALVPHFQQNPTSYMTFAPLNDVYLDMDILLSFRPEATDGLLLYNGQYASSYGDFVCFGMQGQYPEFRFDLGAGPAIIRGAQPLELNRWHTVQLKRNRKNGSMLINDEPPYYGEAPGQHQGLDMVEPMYVGNVPDFSAVPRSAGFSQGFVGGLSQIQIKGVNLNLGAEAREIVNVDQYQVCRDSPCRNGGVCRPENNRFGFMCDCPQGFVGERCELVGQTCYPGACGPQGRCYNLAGGAGFSCVCPIGFTGEGCSRSIRIVDPAFNRTSFISYPKIENGLVSVRIRLMFKPRSLDDGIILYNAQRQDGKQDFIAVLIKDQHLEFRFDTGSGPAVLRSRNPLRVDDWTMVMADRKGRDGMLIVNNEESVNEQVAPNDRLVFPRLERGDVIRGTTSGDRTVGLNLERPLYLGGVDPGESINRDVGTFYGFNGCVGELMVGDDTIGLIDDAIESMNVQDCGDRSLCERRPCRNGGNCYDISPTEYRCSCTSQFTGKNCETEINICVTSEPCQNGGECIATPDGYRCDCPIGWMGRNCDTELALSTNAEFIGNGYAEFAKPLLPHRRRQTAEVIRLTITTTEPNGLFFWQGQKPGEQEGKDYLALAVKDGYVEFRYELGSGPAVITSTQTVDDGFPHLIIAERLGRKGSLLVDDNAQVSGTSIGPLQVLNVAGNIFFGGVPDLGQYTFTHFSENFIGCVSDVRIQDKEAIDFSTDPIGGMNITPCLPAK